MMGHGEVPPNTFAGAPMDDWDRTQLIADLNKRHRERQSTKYVSGSELSAETRQGFIDLRPEVAAIDGILAARIKAHSTSDELHAEGEQ